MDSNSRSSVSAPITIILPKTVQLKITQLSDQDVLSRVSAVIVGSKSTEGGILTLQSSNRADGDFSDVAQFDGTTDSFLLVRALVPGSWVRASLTNSPTLVDAVSQPIQILGFPKVSCYFAAQAKVASKIAGKCTFSIPLTGAPVILQSNFGKGWGTVVSGLINGQELNPSVTPKLTGSLQVRLISQGLSGTYAPFVSNISTIKVTTSLHGKN
jgi:hypothetical protein